MVRAGLQSREALPSNVSWAASSVSQSATRPGSWSGTAALPLHLIRVGVAVSVGVTVGVGVAVGVGVTVGVGVAVGVGVIVGVGVGVGQSGKLACVKSLSWIVRRVFGIQSS